MIMASNKFTVDDVLHSDDEDKVRLYGSTTGSAPLSSNSPKSRLSPALSDTDIQLEEYRSESYVEAANSSPLLGEKQQYSGHLIKANTSLHSSRTSWSEDSNITTRSFQSRISFFNHPKVKENWRIVLGSFILSMVGAALLLAGIGILISSTRGWHVLVFLIAGLVCLIPGAYHLIYIYCAVRGKPGYDLYKLPAFK